MPHFRARRLLLATKAAVDRHTHLWCATYLNARSIVHASAASQPAAALKYPLESIRNVGIIAHIDAGKTTTTERILYLAGETGHVGTVDQGDTVMDYLPQERERGITIQSAAISLDWSNHRVNLLDTPGHVDFTMEVERSVRVIDGAVVVLDAVAGVQAQTETVWRQACKQKVPALVFVNKMDREGADFRRSLQSIRTRLGMNTVPIQMPLGEGAGFVGSIDLLTLEKIIWRCKRGEGMQHGKHSRAEVEMTREPLGEGDLSERAKEARSALLDALSEVDETFLEEYLLAMECGSDVSTAEVIAALRRACVRGVIVPALCGAALRGRGVEPLLDSLITFLPAPVDRPIPVAFKYSHASDTDQVTAKAVSIDPRDHHLCAYAFKERPHTSIVIYNRQRGLITLLRIYAGQLHAKEQLENSTRKKKERPMQLLEVIKGYDASHLRMSFVSHLHSPLMSRVRADDLIPVETVTAGHTVAAVGLRHTYTGDTLATNRGPFHGAVLEGVEVPAPVFALAIEPVSSAAQSDLEEALEILQREDPSLKVEADAESGQILLRGVGELHLEIVCDKLRRAFGIEVETGEAYVAYRESIAGPITTQTVYDRQVGGKRLYAELRLRLHPQEPAHKPPQIRSAETLSLTADEKIALLTGLQDACLRGPKEGYPISGFDIFVEELGKLQAAISSRKLLPNVVRQPVDGSMVSQPHVNPSLLHAQTVTTPGAVRACCVMALAQAMKEAGILRLEPVMSVEILAPTASFGTVLSDLSVSRRALIRDVDGKGTESGSQPDQAEEAFMAADRHVIQAHVPLATLLGYATTLRSLTQGEGSFTMSFSHYAPET